MEAKEFEKKVLTIHKYIEFASLEIDGLHVEMNLNIYIINYFYKWRQLRNLTRNLNITYRE